MNDSIKNRTLTADLSLFIVAAIWGSGFIATQYAIDSGMSSSLIMALRFSIAAISLGLIFFKKVKTINRRELMTGFPAGVLLFLAFFAQTIGLEHTTPSNNAFITSTNVIMVPFISWMLHRKAPRLKSFLLAMACFAGIAVLTWAPGKGIHFNRGDLYTLACAVLFAGHISYLDIASKKIEVSKLTFIQMLIAALLSLLSFDPSSITSADISAGLLPALYLGLFSTSLCFLIQTNAQKRTSSTKAAIFLSTECLFGSFFSVLLGLEPMTRAMILGGSVIMVTILISEMDIEILKLKKTERSPDY